MQLVQGPATIVLARVVPASGRRTRIANATAAHFAAPLRRTKPHHCTCRTRTCAPVAPRNWPSFRGEAGGGNGDGQRAVTEWDVTSGKNIKWKTPIPGIANSSPITWGNRVFVTTAISKAGDKSFRTGLYGDVKPVEDLSEHEWKVYALDKATGKIRVGADRVFRHAESQTAHQGDPGELHACHRRPAHRGRIRIDRIADCVGHERQGVLARRSRRSRQRMVLRSELPVGTLELADHL